MLKIHKRVLIITEGGSRCGLGHVARSISMYQALREKEITAEFIVNGDTTLRKLLKRINYTSFNWLRKENALLGLIRATDIVIVDSYLADKDFYRKIGEVARISVYFDDCRRIEYPRGIVINGNIYAEKLNYSKNNGVVYLLGTQYIAMRKEFWNVPKRKISKNIRNVLVTFGGKDLSGLTQGLISYLKKDFKCNFIEVANGRVNASQIFDLMLECDVCISGGGQTIYELAKCGIPTVAICFADNQLLNLKSWQKAGFLDYVGVFDRRDLFKKIEKSLQRLDYKKRVEMSKVGPIFVDGQGARRIINEIFKYSHGK